MSSAEHKNRVYCYIVSGVTKHLNALQENTPEEEKPDFTTVIETNDKDEPEDVPSGKVLSEVEEEVKQEEPPVVEVPSNVTIEPDATPQEIEQKVQEDLVEKHEAVEACDEEATDLITKLRQILVKDFGKTESVARKYPKQNNMGLYLYYDSAHRKDKGYKREKYAPYNTIIDQLNGATTERLESIADEQKERREAYKSVEKAFENGTAEITQEQAKEVAKAKAIDEKNIAYDNATSETFDKAELEVSKPIAQTSKDLKANKGKGAVYSDLEESKDRLLQDNIKLEQALKQAKSSGNEDLVASLTVALINNASKLESLNVDIDKEKKYMAKVAHMSAIDKAVDEQAENNLDSLVLNGKTYQCKTAIIKENDWKDLTKALDVELIDESNGRDKGYCNMYNSVMLRRLVTHYVIKQFGSTKKITKIYVQDMHLYINDTLVLYQGELFSPKSAKRIPKDVLPYFKNGMLAPFFDWGIFYKGVNCGGRPVNLRTLAFDSTEYLSDYFASDITDMHECKKKDVVKSPYSFLNPDLYFTLFRGLVTLTLEDNTYDRQEWEEQKEDNDSPMMRTMHQKMQREKRRINLLDGYKLDVYNGTNGFQKFGIGCFTNYVKNRGNKGFLRFALGSSMRFVLAGAGIVTNLGAHLIGGIYHSLKSDTEYDWNDNIRDKMNGTSDSPVRASDTAREVAEAKAEAEEEAEQAE